MSKEAEKEKDDAQYLESYADLEIHVEMLKDGPRAKAYKDAIYSYGQAWKQQEGGATVIDVGSGTGLLAVFSARAGAKRVIAVEASRLASYAREIAEKNTPCGVVEVHECRAEDLNLPEGRCVDVIVSEWMGYFLLFENMLPSVLAVRDRYLKPGGTMLPSRCRLFLAPLEDAAWRKARVGFWNDVHGIDMSPIAPLANATACERAQHRLVPKDGLLAKGIEILSLDLLTAKDSDLQRFEVPLDFEIPAGRTLDGFASWFECDLGPNAEVLSTAPGEPETHWRQTAFYLRSPIEGGGGIEVSGTVIVERHEAYTRGYRVTFELQPPARRKRLETYELR